MSTGSPDGRVSEELISNRALGKPTDEAVLARHRSKLDKCLDGLDKVLAKMPFMGGDEYSLVDVFYMPCMYVATRCQHIFEERPALKKWWDVVSAREVWNKTLKPVDDIWGQAVPGWKSSTPNTPEEEGVENRAHL